MPRGYVEASFGQMHYRCNARREGIPLVLLHQSPSDSRMYETLMAELDGDFWMVAPDNPGFGNSDPLPDGFSMEGCADAILHVLESLDIEECYLFGHHTGAAIAVQVAAMNPSIALKLALGGPTLLTDEQKAKLPGMAAAFPLSADGAHLHAMWQRMSGKESDADPALLLREVMSAFNSGDSYQEAYRAVTTQDFEAQLRALDVPVLVFAGSSDVLFPRLQPSFECLQQGKKVEMGAAGSYVCDRQAGELAALLRDFLGKNTG